MIILTGTNSLRAPNINSLAVIDDLTEIRNKCYQNGIRPIFLTLVPISPTNIKNAFHTETDPNWRHKLDQINGFVREQQYYIDLEPYFYDIMGTKLDDRLSVDGLHPDIEGKMKMGEIINQHKNLFIK